MLAQLVVDPHQHPPSEHEQAHEQPTSCAADDEVVEPHSTTDRTLHPLDDDELDGQDDAQDVTGATGGYKRADHELSLIHI